MTKEEQITLLRYADILRRGISQEALDVLKKHFEYGLDVFQFCDATGRPLNKPADILFMEAQKRDGQLSVIRFIEATMKLKPRTQQENDD